MADQQKLKQLMSELRQAVARGDLEQDVLSLAKRGIEVRGNVSDSVLIDGDNNIVLVTQRPAVPAGRATVDEKALVAESIAIFCEEQSQQRRAISDAPYPGLFAYGLQDAPRFFGREPAVAELMAELKQKRVIWLHGRSGTGKSSFLQAGLLPALLRDGAFAVLVRSFDEFPATALKKELLRRRWSTELDLAGESLLRFLGDLDAQLQGREIYIFFDQFEEFLIHLSEALQQDFARQLADCIADGRLPVHFVFSLRSDYFGETVILRERLQPAVHREYVLRQLKPDQARQVIIQPLLQCGISCEEGLVDTILTHLGGSEIDSPQLQLVCDRLFRTLPDGSRQITLQQYKDLDFAKGIINAYLKQAVNDQQLIPADQQKAAIYLLTTLVTADGRRDAKRPSDWYADERIHPWTFAWHAGRGALPAADRALGLELIRHIAFAEYITKISSHVTFQKDELEQLLKGWEKPIVDDYIRQLQTTFVERVILALRGARLIHEIQTVDGQLAYELVHDYLITEIQGWLDEDEQKARELRGMLDQRQYQFKQHRLLLDSKELEIVAAELDNPKFLATEADRRLVLLSAAAHGDAKHWLTVCGPKALDWLREAYQEQTYPLSLRQGAVTALGETDDEETFNQISMTLQQKDSRSRHSIWLDLFAHYLNRSVRDRAVPVPLSWAVSSRLARLRMKEGMAQRVRMSQIAAVLAVICWVIYYVMDPFEGVDLPLKLGAGVVFVLLSVLFAAIFAQVMVSLQWIGQRWAFLLQFLALATAGSAIGPFLFLFMAGRWQLWFVGGIIGLALTRVASGRGLRSGFLAPLIAVVVFALAYFSFAPNEADTWEKLSAALSASIFSGLYVYFSKRTGPSSLPGEL